MSSRRLFAAGLIAAAFLSPSPAADPSLSDAEIAKVRKAVLPAAGEDDFAKIPWRTNIWDALDALEASQLLQGPQIDALRTGYSFLRFVEARLRIVTDRPLTEIPEHPDDLEKLARRAGFDAGKDAPATIAFLAQLNAVRSAIRSVYQAVVDSLRV